MFGNGLASVGRGRDSGPDFSGAEDLPGAYTRDCLSPGENYSGLRLALRENAPLLPRATLKRRWALRGKRVIDLIGAMLGLVLLSPLFLILAAAIALTDRGPVFFSQKRLGLDGAPFEVLKFRSMHVARCDPSGMNQVAVNDTRRTPIGAFMRRTSLDELPQLFNVLKGEMSLVGPRPHVPGMLACGSAYTELVPHYGFRHAMRPGLTGWAQCNGLRGPTLNRRRAISRIGHDIAYVQHFSLRLDLQILLRTVIAVVASKDAL